MQARRQSTKQQITETASQGEYSKKSDQNLLGGTRQLRAPITGLINQSLSMLLQQKLQAFIQENVLLLSNITTNSKETDGKGQKKFMVRKKPTIHVAYLHRHN